MRKSGIIALSAVAGLAASAGAQTMTFSWNSSHGPDVFPGDVVTIELVASWDPANTGFAGSIFSVYDTAGGSCFFGGGSDVQVARADALDDFADPPTMEDSDANGQIDVIDNIDTFQLPPFFNPGFDSSNPLTLMTITWTVGNNAGNVSLQAGAAINGTFTADVYTDTFGTSIPYQRVDNTLDLRCVPAPSSVALLGLGGLVAARRRR